MQTGVRKANKKKKQVKGEFDLVKQAEKKRRRLEKALATSAAIRSELEKKKQKKIEEQQRLDEEGAAIAEAVALRVLLGEEDSDDSRIVRLKKDNKGFNPWECNNSFGFFMGGNSAPVSKHSLEGIEWGSNGHVTGYESNYWGNNSWRVSSAPFITNDHLNDQSFNGGWETSEISAGLLAVQAASSLRIAEDAHVDAYGFNRILRG